MRGHNWDFIGNKVIEMTAHLEFESSAISKFLSGELRGDDE